MLIAFEGPLFFAAQDEDQFFGWLYSVPEFKDIVGAGTTLNLELTPPVSAETVKQLLVVFRRWCIDPQALLCLRSPETDSFMLWDTSLQEASSKA